MKNIHPKSGADQSVVGRIASIPGTNAVEAITKLAEMGCRRIEIPIGNADYFDAFDANKVAELKRVLNSTGVTVHSFHGSFVDGMDIGSPDTDARRASILLHRQSVLLAAEANARYLIVHPSKHWGEDDRALRIDLAADAVAEIAALAHTCGVVIAVENMLGTVIGCHEDELLQIISRASPEDCGICFDSGHANLKGRAVEMARALLPHTVTTHLHDNDGKDDLHQFPGEGMIDWAALGGVFREVNCGAWLLIESHQGGHTQWSSAESGLLRLIGLNGKTPG